MGNTFTQRDKEISHYIHRLFWKATFEDMPTFIGWAVARPAAMFIYNVLFPVVIAYGLQAIVTRNFSEVGYYAGALMGLAILYCILWGVGGVFICKNGARGTEYIQRAIFGNYLQKDYEFYSNTYVGALGAQALRLKDAFNSYCQLMLNGVAKHIILVVSSITIIAFQSLLLAAVTFACMLLVLSFTILSSKWRMRYRRALSEADNEVAGVVGDALGHGTTVKSFAREAYEEKRLKSAMAGFIKALYQSWMSSIPADLGRMVLAAGTTAVLLLITAHMYQQHAISIAIVALVQLYVIKLVAATQEIADTIKTYETIMSSAHQPAKTMLIESAVTDAPSVRRLAKHDKLAVSFKNVVYRYDDTSKKSSAAIDSFTLEIAPGEKVGLVGYSGSGKTTLTKLLLRFMDVTDGSIKVDGIDIREVAQRDLRSRIAYVPQEPLLFHRSIMDNIAYGKPEAPQKVVLAAAEAAYVNEFVKELPQGFDTQVGERGVKLSGGQRQRVAIARAILKDAPVLVLDEATSALDSRSEKLIQRALWRLMKGRTAIVIAHRLSTIQHMDRIVVMDKGRVVQIGTHDELLRCKGVYASLWSHQSGGYLGDMPGSTWGV